MRSPLAPAGWAGRLVAAGLFLTLSVALLACSRPAPPAEASPMNAPSGPAPDASASDSLVLANATGQPLVYELVHPRMGRPVRESFTVHAEAPPATLVPAGEAAVLLPCSGLAEFRGGQILLYRLSSPEDGRATARLVRSVELTEAYLEARQQDCRVEVGSL